MGASEKTRGSRRPTLEGAAAVAAVASFLLTALGPLPQLIKWSLIVVIMGSASVFLVPEFRKAASLWQKRARRPAFLVLVFALLLTGGYFIYDKISKDPTAVRRRGELNLRLGQHADLDSTDANWDQGTYGYKGDIYFDTGRQAKRPPRIQAALKGPEQYTRFVPVGTGFEVAPQTCDSRLRESPTPHVPLDKLAPGYQLCVETGERRWAFLTVRALTDSDHVKFAVVVWEGT